MHWTISLSNLNEFATTFWQAVGDERVFLFYGEMGAGKTTLIEALCAANGVKEAMSSPTFSIINEYVYTEDGSQKTIYHIDLYRLDGEEEISRAGVEDCLYSGAICFVEWPQKAPPHFYDAGAVAITITALNDMERTVAIALPAAD